MRKIKQWAGERSSASIERGGGIIAAVKSRQQQQQRRADDICLKKITVKHARPNPRVPAAAHVVLGNLRVNVCIYFSLSFSRLRARAHRESCIRLSVCPSHHHRHRAGVPAKSKILQDAAHSSSPSSSSSREKNDKGEELKGGIRSDPDRTWGKQAATIIIITSRPSPNVRAGERGAL